MGGCCCCSSKARELSAAPTYYYVYPRTSEQVPLSSRQGGAALSTGLLVDTNLDTSSPDTYRPPPAPIPYDVSVERPRTPPAAQEISGNKSDATLPTTTTSDSGQDAAGDSSQETSAKCEDLKDSDGKAETTLELDPVKKSEKSVEPMALVIDEEDVCPTCLEEYDEENPKITTKCDHHYHLACILEWMERSDTCPVCDQEMIFDPPID